MNSPGPSDRASTKAKKSQRPEILPLSMASATRDQVQRAAMLASVSGHSFEDVKFWAFSRRSHSGIVDQPLPLLANSGLLHKVTDHFKFVLSTGFAEGDVVEMEAPFPSTRSSSSDMYDYASDSDLDDEDELDAPIKNDPLLARVGVQVGQSRGKSSTKQDENSDDGADHKVADSGINQSDAVVKKPGRVVHVEDVAYHTLKAFIFWAYYEELNFAPLKSQQKMMPAEQYAYSAPFCSPKSMYRLANRYDIPKLKDLALNDIRSKLTNENILEELFSSFTTLYPDVRNIEIQYLRNCMTQETIRRRLPSWIEAMEKGELPRGAAGIVSALLGCT